MSKPNSFFVGCGVAWLNWHDRTVAVFGPPWPREGDWLFARLQSGRIAQFSFTERIDDVVQGCVFAEVEDDRFISPMEFMHRFGKLTRIGGKDEMS